MARVKTVPFVITLLLISATLTMIALNTFNDFGVKTDDIEGEDCYRNRETWYYVVIGSLIGASIIALIYSWNSTGSTDNNFNFNKNIMILLMALFVALIGVTTAGMTKGISIETTFSLMSVLVYLTSLVVTVFMKSNYGVAKQVTGDKFGAIKDNTRDKYYNYRSTRAGKEDAKLTQQAEQARLNQQRFQKRIQQRPQLRIPPGSPQQAQGSPQQAQGNPIPTATTTAPMGISMPQPYQQP
jgi:hypothetical protein